MKISKYYIIALLAAIINCKAQTRGEWTRGIRLGCDLSKIALPLIDNHRKGIEFSIDTEWKSRLFITGELGFENVSKSIDNLQYQSNGIYARIGYDKNILKHDNPKYKDVFSFGFRYGMAVLHENATHYQIIDEYWGNVNESLSSKTLHAHWLEMVTAVKSQVIQNFYLGFSVRIKVMLYSNKGINYPYVYPGFGNGERKLIVGFNYSIYYQIPLMKVKAKAASN